MQKRGWIILLSAILMAWGSGGWAAEAVKIGYVNMQRALNMCDAGKEAKKVITHELEKIQKTMGEKQKELDALKDDLGKRATVMSEAARREKEADYQRKLRDFQRMQRDYEDDLRRKDRQLTDRILKDLEGIVKKMGEEGKYIVIFERNQPAIVFIAPGLDLTDEVIKLANQKKK
jgi:outer membrane protein